MCYSLFELLSRTKSLHPCDLLPPTFQHLGADPIIDLMESPGGSMKTGLVSKLSRAGAW